MQASRAERFIAQGYLRLDAAFPPELAAQAREILWRDLAGVDRRDPATWPAVRRLGLYSQPPFVAAANTPMLHSAFDELVGVGRWQRCGSVGTFPVRFPSPRDPGDAGWHVDVSYDFDLPNFLDWRANVYSRGRALLMLMLFSDVGPDDAPTLIRAGSHLDIARRLAPAGEHGLTLGELAANGFAESAHREVVPAVGAAGSVYLCHPFLVHSAQAHRGTMPKFMAQPPLLPAPGVGFRTSGDGLAPVEQAIRRAITGV